MKKLILSGVIGTLLLSGCSMPVQKVVFDKKSQSIDSLEDKLEAKLKKENHGKKYDVDITKETKKKKKRKKH